MTVRVSQCAGSCKSVRITCSVGFRGSEWSVGARAVRATSVRLSAR